MVYILNIIRVALFLLFIIITLTMFSLSDSIKISRCNKIAYILLLFIIWIILMNVLLTIPVYLIKYIC